MCILEERVIELLLHELQLLCNNEPLVLLLSEAVLAVWCDRG